MLDQNNTLFRRRMDEFDKRLKKIDLNPGKSNPNNNSKSEIQSLDEGGMNESLSQI